MSRRARITLNPAPEPDVETEPNHATEADPLPKTGARTGTGNDFAAAADKPARPSAPAKGALNVGAIIKIVFAGLAAASLVLLWRNRRF